MVLTLPAMRGSIVLGNPSWLLCHSVSLKIPGKNRGEKNPGEQHPAVRGCHAHSPKQPVNLDDSQPLRAPVSVRTSQPSVQQCPLPPATAFPHPQRFTAESRRKHPSSPRCLTSAHLLWQPSVRRHRRLAGTGGTSTTWRLWQWAKWGSKSFNRLIMEIYL